MPHSSASRWALSRRRIPADDEDDELVVVPIMQTGSRPESCAVALTATCAIGVLKMLEKIGLTSLETAMVTASRSSETSAVTTGAMAVFAPVAIEASA